MCIYENDNAAGLQSREVDSSDCQYSACISTPTPNHSNTREISLTCLGAMILICRRQVNSVIDDTTGRPTCMPAVGTVAAL